MTWGMVAIDVLSGFIGFSLARILWGVVDEVLWRRRVRRLDQLMAGYLLRLEAIGKDEG